MTKDSHQQNIPFPIDALKDAVFLIDVEPNGIFRFSSVNKQFLLNLGLEYDDVIGKSLDEVIPAESVLFVKAKYQEAIKARVPIEWEETIQLKTGPKTGIVSISPIENAKGVCTQLSGSISDITEWKKTESTLEKVMQQSMDLICIIDRDGNFVHISDSSLSILNYMPKELSGKRFLEFVHPEDRERSTSVTENVISGKPVINFENRYIRKDGSPVDLSWSARWDESGQLMYCTAKDISEIKQKNREVELLLNNTRESFILLNKELNIVSFNQQFKTLYEKFFGISIKKGANIIQYAQPDRKDDVRKIYQKVLSGGTEEAEITIPVNGDFLTFQLNYTPARNESNEIIGAFVTASDITEKKLIFEQVRRSEQNYRNLFNSSPLPKWIYDLHSLKIVYVNSAALIQYGYSKNEFLDLDLEQLWADRDIKDFLSLQPKTLAHDKINDFGVLRHQRKDQSLITVELTGYPINFDNKQCVMLLAKDVTRQKEFEILLNQATKLAKIGSWELNLLNNTVYWSDMTRKIYGVGSDFTPTVEDGLDFYVEGKSRTLMWDVVQKAINHGTPWDIEVQIQTKKGKIKWVRSIGEAEILDGTCVRLYGSFQDVDKRKKTEIAFKKAAKHRDDILASISDAFYAMDSEWNFTYFNKEAERLLGKKAKHVLGKSIWTEFAPAVETELHSIYHDVQKTKEPRSFEYYYPPLDSWYDISAYPSESGVAAYFKNINERKKTQAQILNKTNQLDAIASFNSYLIKKDSWLQALHESLGLFGHVVNADRVYYFDVEDSKNTDNSLASLKIEWVKNGITPEINNPDNQNFPFSDVHPFSELLPEKRYFSQLTKDVSNTFFKDMLESQGIKSVLIVSVFTNSKLRGFIGFDDCTKERIWSDDELTFLQTISLNLASAIENEEAELALQTAYDEKNEILESIGDGFFTLDENFNVTYWNYQAEQLLMTSKDEILGKYLWDHFDKEKAPNSYNHYLKAMNERIPLEFDDFYEPINRWFGVSIYPTKNGLSVYFKNITEKKEAEAHLKELNNSLERQTRELAASNAQLEQFAFVASHDLQEPLRMITSFLTQIERKYSSKLDEKGKRYIYFATDGARRMRQIILDLLEYSRVGRSETDRETFEIKDVIDEALQLNNKLITESKAVINFGEMPQITGLKGPVSQLFQNLITNALKYQNKGNQPIVTIKSEEDDSYWYFSISDNGIGISEEYHHKIFNIFYRLHTADEYSGTGMGLSICKKVVDEHDGKIWVESAQEKGSTFHFSFAKNSKKNQAPDVTSET